MKRVFIFAIAGLVLLTLVSSYPSAERDDELEQREPKKKHVHKKQNVKELEKAEKDKEKNESKAEKDKEKAEKDKKQTEKKAEKNKEKAEKDKEKAEKKAEKDKEKAEKDKEIAEKKAEKNKEKAEIDKEKAEKKAEKDKEKAKKDMEKAEKDKEKAEKRAKKDKEKAEKKAKKDKEKAEKKEKREREKRKKWEKVEKMLKEKKKDFWIMEDEILEKHYPKKLKEKISKGEKLKQSEIDEFENKYGRYKSRPETTVIDLMNSINKAHDVTTVDDVDIVRHNVPEKVKRSTRMDQFYLWKSRTIPYEIDTLLLDVTEIIVASMQEISSFSCIKFVKRTTEKNWIKFVKKSGCWSSVGQNFWIEGFQEISLGNGCIYKGIIQHEILHSLGFNHEQTRYDRDKFVEIFWENIPSGSAHNFEKEKSVNFGLLGTSYDYGSIMQYGKYSFASDPSKPTILSIKNPSTELGQRTHLSQLDIYELNELYSCSVGGTGWSAWSMYGPCSTDCLKERSRFCMDPNDKTNCANPTSTTMIHWGIDLQRISCTNAECYAPIDGHWNKWGSWSECSSTCDSGTRTRTRECTDPAPRNGGAYCVGSNTNSVTCLLISCTAGPNDCTFDIDFSPLCNWQSDITADFQWKRNSGGTPSSSTGPSQDHTSGNGYYMYIETSSPVVTGNKARLISQIIPAGTSCFKFAYHMYGYSTGSLSVFTKQSVTAEKKVFFYKEGDQLNQWHLIKFDVSAPNPYHIVIEGVKGSSYQSDIGIDDIVIRPGSCTAPKTTTTTTSTTTTTPETTTTTPETTTTTTPTTTTTDPTTTTTPPPPVPAVESVGCYQDVGYIDGVRPFALYKSFDYLVKWTSNITLAKENFNDIVGNCSAFARANNHKYFAIQYYYECWTGAIEYGRDGESTGCWPGIDANAGPFIIGTGYTNMVYRWDD